MRVCCTYNYHIVIEDRQVRACTTAKLQKINLKIGLFSFPHAQSVTSVCCLHLTHVEIKGKVADKEPLGIHITYTYIILFYLHVFVDFVRRYRLLYAWKTIFLVGL